MIIGYGICGAGEADRYMEATLEEFKRLCDETIIVLNNATEKERNLVERYGFHIKEDNREWGNNQHLIKEDLMKEIAKMNPTYLVCLDMDEVFDSEMTKDKLIKLFETGNALYFYIVNLWNDGWNRKWSFWNVRAWKWNGDTKFENRPLHCGLAPAWCYRYGSYAPHFVAHYGLMTKESRQRKIERYEKYDPDAIYKDRSYYEALKQDESDKLDYGFIRKSLIKEIGIQKKRTEVIRSREFYYVKRPDGKVIDIPGKSLQEHLKRGFELVGRVGEDVKASDKFKIAYIGKFEKMWDEEHIARTFEKLGCDVVRIPDRLQADEILLKIDSFNPDVVLFAKLDNRNSAGLIEVFKDRKITSVCWLFDLYWGYTRENQIHTKSCFKADYVITTDGGHDDKWIEAGVNHFTVRQGIYEPEAFRKNEKKKPISLLFVGSDNPYNTERNAILNKLEQDFDLTWVGKKDTDEFRGTALNDLYGKTKVVVGDSVYSPHYWSNRVVETLGRGGFLIHRDVPGIKEAYPHLVTYTDYEDLKKKIKYYQKNTAKREEIINKNLEWVKQNYLCSHQCQKVLNIINE